MLLFRERSGEFFKGSLSREGFSLDSFSKNSSFFLSTDFKSLFLSIGDHQSKAHILSFLAQKEYNEAGHKAHEIDSIFRELVESETDAAVKGLYMHPATFDAFIRHISSFSDLELIPMEPALSLAQLAAILSPSSASTDLNNPPLPSFPSSTSPPSSAKDSSDDEESPPDPLLDLEASEASSEGSSGDDAMDGS